MPNDASMEFAKAIAAHVDELHRLQFDPEQVTQWISEHEDLVLNLKPVAINTNNMVQLMLAEMHGKLAPTLVDPDHRSGGYVEKIDVIASNQERVLDTLDNGGVKIRIPPWLTTIIVAILGLVGVIAAAVISATLGNPAP